MPYGMPKEMGGDNKMMDAKMEKCVMKVMAQGKAKSNAIAICKSSMMKGNERMKKMDKMMK